MKKIILLLTLPMLLFTACKKEEIVKPPKPGTQEYYVAFGLSQNLSGLQISNIDIELYDTDANQILPFETTDIGVAFKVLPTKNCFAIIKIYAQYANPFTYIHTFIAPTTDLFNLYVYAFSFSHDSEISYHIVPAIGVAKYDPTKDISTFLR